MRKFYFFAIGFILFPFAGSATIHEVVNVGFTFSPATLTIDFGDSVDFTIGGAHQVREVSQTTWDANGNTALSGGFQTAAGGGMLLPASLPVGTHYYVCIPHASMGMKGTIIVNPSSLNVKENKPELNFSLYPNPTNGVFNVNLNSSVDVSKIEVYNLLGEVVYNTNVVTAKTTIDLSNNERGIYFVKIFVNEAVLTKKIVLQ
jgi:plastocyanin